VIIREEKSYFECYLDEKEKKSKEKVGWLLHIVSWEAAGVTHKGKNWGGFGFRGDEGVEGEARGFETEHEADAGCSVFGAGEEEVRNGFRDGAALAEGRGGELEAVEIRPMWPVRSWVRTLHCERLRCVYIRSRVLEGAALSKAEIHA
jgi:hypothetical protein